MATVNGSGGNDTLTGTKDPDLINAYGGDDSIVAKAGNDTIYGGDGDDTIDAGSGNDSVFGGSGGDFLFGDEGDDTLRGEGGYDVMVGGDGNDVLIGDHDSFDDFYGGAGDDSIYAGDADDDWAWGGDGADYMEAGGGADLFYGGSGNDTILGEAGDDSLKGDLGDDLIYGGEGADNLTGGGGSDTIDGGTDDDSIAGSSGGDSLLGGAGNDTIHGDRENAFIPFYASGGPIDTSLTVVNAADFAIDLYWIDGSGTAVYTATIAAGGSFTQATGTAHNWFITETGQQPVLEVIQGAPNQTVTFGPDFDDTIDGGAGDDLIHGEYGDDTLYGGEGADTVYGGAGDDSIGSFQAEGAGDDLLYGGAGNDTIVGGGENDTLYGGAGDDWLSAGIGSDSMFGGDGADVFLITEDHETDTIFGGEGGTDFDSIYFGNWLSNSGVTVTFTGAEQGTYAYALGGATGQFSEIEVVAGTDFADTIDASASTADQFVAGNDGADSITGGSGNDTLDGGVGNDTLEGGSGNDSLSGADGADLLFGGRGDDTLSGGAGDDTLSGGDGNDRLEAGASGADWLTGGAGADTFQPGAGNMADAVVITDFDLSDPGSTGATTDQLDVSELERPGGGGVTVWDVAVSDDGSGNALLTFPGGERVILQGISPAQMSTAQMSAMGIPCFASGTPILTPAGERAVEDIAVGDLVTTRGGEALPVLWHGRRELGPHQLSRAPRLLPIRIRAGAFGNRIDLLVSPQHGMVATGPDGQEHLIRARHIAEAAPSLARVARGRRAVTYHHLLLPRHEVIFAAGAATESFFPGPTAIASLLSEQRRDLLAALGRIGSLAPAHLGLRPSDGGFGGRVLPLCPRPAAQRLAASLAAAAEVHRPDPGRDLAANLLTGRRNPGRGARLPA